MSQRQFFTSTLFALLSLFLIQKTTYAEPPNLSQLITQIKTYHDSGAYEQELNQAIKNAQDFINQRADSNKQLPHPQKLAVVLDIDETSLSNYDHMATHDFAYSKKRWKKEVFAAHSPAIKPMLALYQDAIKHDVSVIFVTGRHESEREPTSKNLINAGYQKWAALYLRPAKYSETSIIPFKSSTRKIIEQQGFTIIASIGDQFSDLKGGYAEKTFKLPNPYYYIP